MTCFGTIYLTLFVLASEVEVVHCWVWLSTAGAVVCVCVWGGGVHRAAHRTGQTASQWELNLGARWSGYLSLYAHDTVLVTWAMSLLTLSHSLIESSRTRQSSLTVRVKAELLPQAPSVGLHCLLTGQIFFGTLCCGAPFLSVASSSSSVSHHPCCCAWREEDTADPPCSSH